MKTLHDMAAPAKLNLFLHVTGRRPDGYHLIQSVFMLIDWCDTLHFEIRNDGQLSREDLLGELPAEDLVLRAARALKSHTGCPLGAHIGIEKRIPTQAGMGGGSSDAATCLLALNRLWNLKLPRRELETLGLDLGADVPFFLRGRNAWVEGVGEIITPLEREARLELSRFIVVKPAAGLDTGKIFAAEDLQRDTKPARISGFAGGSKFDFGHNDLQSVAKRYCPEIGSALQWLECRGLSGRMTGSGSAVFAQCRSASQPPSEAELPSGWQMRICSNLDVHPLLEWASCGNELVGSADNGS
jgi:4-diphosphocytidyl-2-C-methyl-D-erythritol kinase